MSVTPISEEGFVPPTLQLGEFQLRPLRVGDEEAYFDYLSDPQVIEHTSFPVLDLEAARVNVERCIADYSRRLGCRWALANPEGLLVGTCGFSTWSLPHGHAELVYDLHPEYQGRGLMTLAVAAVVAWAFSQANFIRVQAFVMTSNRPSIALLERSGFRREGTLRSYRSARGTPSDFHLYARLRSDLLPGAG